MTETEEHVHDGNRGACALRKHMSLCITETEEPVHHYGNRGACALQKQEPVYYRNRSLCITETEEPVHDGNRKACALRKQRSLCSTER